MFVWCWVSAFPSDYAKRLLLLVPALPLALHAKLTGQAYDAKHTASISSSSTAAALTTPPALAQVLIVVVIVELLLSSSPSLTTLISVSPGIVRIPHARFRPSPFTNPPSTSAHPPAPTHPRRSGLSVLPPLDDRQTGRRTDTQSDRHQVGNSESQEAAEAASQQLCRIA